MPLIVVFVIIIILFLILTVVILSQPPKGTDSTVDYNKNFSLLSATEKAFLETLDSLFGDDLKVFVKVRLTELIRITPHPQKGADLAALAKIDATTVDFVLCNPKDLAIVGVIDLEDKSLSSDAGSKDNDFIAKAAAAAQLPFIRLPAQPHYNKEETAKILEAGFKLQEQATARKPAAGEYGSCPNCGEPLMLLKAQYGDNIGQHFFGCSNYPECKYLSLASNKDPLRPASPDPANRSRRTAAPSPQSRDRHDKR